MNSQVKNLLRARYLLPGESYEEFVGRVTKHGYDGLPDHVKKNEHDLYKRIYDIIYSRKFLPSRMPLMGTERPFSSSCFVLPIHDSIEGILNTLKNAVILEKFGGGVGYNFSSLRPEGDLIETTKGKASGPVSFMHIFNEAMTVVKRAGKKHSAQMAVLNVDHPDIEKFIKCKDVEGELSTFNISVGISDDFMDAVKNNSDWELKFGGKVYKTVKAREIWDLIKKQAYKNGEPGVIFLDRVNQKTLYPEKIVASNPCSEQFLPEYGTCNLGSINLAKFVKDNVIDESGLREAVRLAVYFLDGSLSNAWFPVKEIEKRARKYKNIGLGVMGWHDMLIKLSIPYDSEEALLIADQVMSIVQKEAETASILLGNGKRKNITLTSIAPTGSISFLAGCSSSIEPIFGVVYSHKSTVGDLYVINPLFEKIAKERNFYSKELMEKIAKTGSVQNIDEVPKDVQRLFKLGIEIDPKWHILHQARFQGYIDNGISKTINLPENASVSDVGNAYKMAYDSGCLSCTVYRNKSRTEQVVNIGNNKTDKNLNKGKGGVMKRPDVLSGKTVGVNTPNGKSYVTVNFNENEEPVEVFINVGKAGTAITALAEALGRLVSLLLRIDSSVSRKERLLHIVDEVGGIGTSRSNGFGENRILSLPDGVAKAIKIIMNSSNSLFVEKSNTEANNFDENNSIAIYDLCPSCGNFSFTHESGCKSCVVCGYAEC